MPKPLLPDRPVTRFERSAALASFVAGCLFALLLWGSTWSSPSSIQHGGSSVNTPSAGLGG